MSNSSEFDFLYMKSIHLDMIQELFKRQSYQNGKSKDMSDEEVTKMEVLDLLEELGYPIEEYGTYLYSEVISSLRSQLGVIKTRNQVSESKELLMQAKYPYSQLYFNLARNERDMGVKKFHSIIERALLKINYENASSETLYKVYGNFPFEMDYGENAFTLANYLNQDLEKQVIRKQTYRSEN